MAFIMEGSRPLEMIASEANGGRSREAVRLTGSVPLIPGTFLAGEIGGDFTMATSPASVTAILLYHADPRDGGIDVAVLFRDCEVNDAYLVYGNMEPAAVNTALRERGIIVRRGVLVNPATELQRRVSHGRRWCPQRSSRRTRNQLRRRIRTPNRRPSSQNPMRRARVRTGATTTGRNNRRSVRWTSPPSWATRCSACIR